ncbi:hypothetical protein D9619_004927 [Psilocybe cf. subviscida]|uniref:Erg28-like protein n=1 Tax=Psilocybe cf. subviscida TaxID=2480587 RepID=A0A8H5F7I8_9AGAR|nr:hypothetical protein D9619_004927 [Psilocybe cf. subviscida]
MLASLAANLPQSDGLLAYWQLIVASAAVFNTVQNFFTLKFTRKIYNNVPATSVTPLQARTFGVWTLTSAVIRFYAAYHINNKAIYDMALASYLIAFFHFSTELFTFGTATINAGVMSPVVVSTTSLFWMLSQYGFYVRA